ncbi:peroxiredoxin [Kiritimatiellaeota bacterium B1221]|nr:peroxiredoxin [Kiritimatiellaeota bacterium B1221]
MSIEAGNQAPDFQLPDADGNIHRLKDYAGKIVVLYFYPKDDTPGCTKEACTFRDLSADFEKLDVVVLGVSPDSAEDHEAFSKKFNLPFPLLSDPEKEVMTAYGAYGEKMMYGKIKIGVIRSTTVIGPDGKVLKHWKKVPKAETHPEKVLEFISGLA